MARAKGASLVGAVKWLRQSRDAALQALPAHLHHYLDERIQIASWYPEEDLVELVRALARILPAGEGDRYEQMGRFSARDQLAGVYRHLLEGGDALSLPRRGLVLWQSQHDSGRLSVTLEGAGSARIEVVDYAMPTREMCAILLGYTAEMFVMAELSAPSVRKTACRLDGAERCAWQVSWTPAPAAAAAAGR
jgi:hypothetical protein